jgi:hypothetical protein
MGRAYGSARAIWLGTRNPIVDDTPLLSWQDPFRQPVFDLPPTESPVRLSMALTAEAFVTDRSCPFD